MLTDLQYIQLFDKCKVLTSRLGEVNSIINAKLLPNKSRYQLISDMISGKTNRGAACFIRDVEDPSTLSPALQKIYQTSINVNFAGNLASAIPWYFIGCVHYRESNCNFSRHLHNGDPLTGYTKQYPAHRPQVGHGPPFTFEESAVDALKLRKLDKFTSWTLPQVLSRLEGYNGASPLYAKNHINSPYLWGGSDLYSKGGFPRDHVFDLNYVNKQLGVAIILKELELKGTINIPRH